MAGILNIGTSALNVFQRSLSSTGHNIANADTEGYSRQRTLTATQAPQLLGSDWMGTGVKTVGIERLYDDFLAGQLRATQSTAAEHETFFEHAGRIDDVFSDPHIGLDPAMQQFFSALHGLADDPASVPSRQLLLSESQSLVNRFHDLNRQFGMARDQLNQELRSVTQEITDFADALANVNQRIIEARGAAGGGEPNDLLDERDRLLNELAKRVDISVVPQDDGAWNVFVGKGQALVMGVKAATLTTQNGTSDLGQLDIAFDAPGGNRVITDQLSGGELGGLLKFRSQILDPGQNQLGLLAVGISDRLNAQHQLGLDLDGRAGRPLFEALEIVVTTDSANSGGASVSASYLDTGNLTISDYRLEATANTDEFTLRRLSDGQTTTLNTAGAYPYTTAEVDGFSLTISAAADAGDSFLIRPTRDAAALLSLQINDVRQFAAAAPLRAEPAGNQVTGGPNEGSGAITQPAISTTQNLPLTGPSTIALEWDPDAGGVGVPGFFVTGGPGGTLLYDPNSESAGKTFSFPAYGEMSFTINGTPVDGDQFVIENNTDGVGDNRNALAMAGLQTENTLFGQVGGGKETATFQEAYSALVADVGAKTRQAELHYQAGNVLVERHKHALLSVSGVNLDEEAADLIRYQQAYQAAAQVIGVARTLFDTLLGSMRG